MGRPYRGIEDIPDWCKGRNGPSEEAGRIQTQPDIYATLHIIERIVQQLAPRNQLRAFGWETWYLPISDKICGLLRDCESLSTLVIGPDGHHNTTSKSCAVDDSYHTD